MRYVLGVEYDGSAFSGWQYQPLLPAGQTVQGVLEAALGRVMASPVKVFCAGRTDAGVHATGQVVHFDSPIVRSPRALLLGTNSHLPRCVAVRWVREGVGDFHARFSALSRTYRYVICNTGVHSAIYADRATWYRYPLDVTVMHEAAKCLLGEHDFSTFRAAECDSHTPYRRMLAVSVVRKGPFVIIELTANAFLQRMVRNIAGTLMEAGRGRRPAAWVAGVLHARDRRLAGPTALPDGLYLCRVAYPPEYGLPVADESLLPPVLL